MAVSLHTKEAIEAALDEFQPLIASYDVEIVRLERQHAENVAARSVLQEKVDGLKADRLALFPPP